MRKTWLKCGFGYTTLDVIRRIVWAVMRYVGVGQENRRPFQSSR